MKKLFTLLLLTGGILNIKCAFGQQKEQDPWQRSMTRSGQRAGQSQQRDTSWWAHRWYISLNPSGIVEGPAMAFGAGIGYRLNKRMELFSEASYLASDQYYFVSPLSGFRGIFKARYYLQNASSRSSRSEIFIGLDLRYKKYKYGDSNDFANGILHDTLMGVNFQSRHHFFGAGLEIGYRTPLSRNGRFQIELTAGVGVKWKTIERVGPPAGYAYMGRYLSIDYNIRDGMEQDGVLPYFPAAMRFLVCFGKIR